MGNTVSIVRGFLDQHILVKASVVNFTIQWMFCSLAFHYQTETVFDLVGSSSFIYLSWATLFWSKRGTSQLFFKRQIMQNFCVSVWAARLGTFLYARQIRTKNNKRFHRARQDCVSCFKLWTIQGIWVYITLLPTFVLNLKSNDRAFNFADYVGFSLWACGFFTEAIADYQKSIFHDNIDNRGKFITTGLWSLCRHPNYLGEIILWLGLFLPAANCMEDLEQLSALSPLFVAYLLINISGVPRLEQRADQKWGSLREYQIYKSRTAKLFPFLW